MFIIRTRLVVVCVVVTASHVRSTTKVRGRRIGKSKRGAHVKNGRQVMDEVFAMLQEYRRRAQEHLGAKWRIVKSGLASPTQAQRLGLKPGCLWISASSRSERFGEDVTVCVGIGTPDGSKMPFDLLTTMLEKGKQEAEAKRIAIIRTREIR